MRHSQAVDSEQARRFRFAFDIGGTFTDLVVSDGRGRRMAVGKCLTQPGEITRFVVEALARLLEREQIPASAIQQVVAGATTLVTNRIIERKGAHTGLITTHGFGDVLEIRREMRYDIYDLTATLAEPIVPRHLRREVQERLDSEGGVLVPLGEDGVAAAIKSLVADGVESLAVCFLHSYRNSMHERRVAEIAAEVAPQLMISLSSDILPEIREYERTTATVLNAYVRPFIGRYFEELQQAFRQIGIDAVLHVMQSNGGVISRDFAERFPLWMLESGPAAGALAAAYLGRLADAPNLLSFDMGGTTAKACLISNGQPHTTTEFETARVHRFKKGSGFPIKLPVIDLIEIGAGGGSIAYVDATGLLKVGPASAGAQPGPACYGLGGVEPTVTDADLVLGYLDPEYFLGGEMKLRVDLGREAIRTKIAQPLGMPITEAASGIYRIVSENMAAAAKVHAAEKGKDIRRYTLLAFGGAGPVHAREVARRTGIGRVMVPLKAGVLSAIGLLAAPVKVDSVRTHFGRLRSIEWKKVNNLYAEMQQSAVELLTQIGVPEKGIVLNRSVDMRYVGQGYEVTVPLPSGEFNGTSTARVTKAFHDVYAERFGHHLMDVPIESLSWRLEAVAPTAFRLPSIPVSAESAKTKPKGERQAFFPEAKKFMRVPVFEHASLPPGARMRGPLIIEQRESTTVVGPKDTVTVDTRGNVIISVNLEK
jgi:N-methylhydantoinase A